MNVKLLRLDESLGAGDPDDDDKTVAMPLADRLWQAIVSDIARGRLTPVRLAGSLCATLPYPWRMESVKYRSTATLLPCFTLS